MNVESLRARLAEYGQEHLLTFWDQLDEDAQRKLYGELDDLDLAEVTEYFQRTIATLNEATEKLDDRMEPLTADQCGSIFKVSDGEREDYQQRTFRAVSDGKLAILLLAGGQGTRLGVSYPKGMYDVGLPSGKTLFQLQAERILSLQRLAEKATGKKGRVVWYIMTSASTVKPTTDFFVNNNYFGLNSTDVVVFQQGTLPCFTFEGKIILGNKGELARAPDGNGGLYRALRKDGIIDDMEKRGVEYVQLFCVDNILVRVGDPLFVGYCISKGAECANKTVAKSAPNESVGITCKVDGHYQVVEYSEITARVAEARDADGSLTYSAANLCIHYFTRAFLRRVVDEHERQLVHHVAKKKIPTLDLATGEPVKPSAPNGIKMEKFVFDVFRFADNFVVWECAREEEFAPLKVSASNNAGILIIWSLPECGRRCRFHPFLLPRRLVRPAPEVPHGSRRRGDGRRRQQAPASRQSGGAQGAQQQRQQQLGEESPSSDRGDLPVDLLRRRRLGPLGRRQEPRGAGQTLDVDVVGPV